MQMAASPQTSHTNTESPAGPIEDPLEQALLYRRYVLQFPLNARLAFLGWSVSLVLLSAPGLRTRLWRTGVTTGVLGLFLSPELFRR